MFAREGYPFILGAAAFAAIAFAMALRLRSWPLWIVALVLTILALSVSWFFRNPERIDERGPTVAVAGAGVDKNNCFVTTRGDSTVVRGPALRVAFFTHVSDVTTPGPRRGAPLGQPAGVRAVVSAHLAPT